MMRIFINLFLAAFALDATISAADDLSYLLFERHPFETVRNLPAFAVFGLSPFVYLATGLDSRLPKALLLPLALFAIWAGFGCLPLTVYFEHPLFMPTISLLQLGLAAYAFSYVRSRTGHWLLPRASFDGLALQFKNSALFALANIVLAPVALALLLGASAWLYLERKTAGFMRVGIDGIRLQERSYVRDDRTVRLLAMMHIGSARYYRELAEYLGGGEALVLTEGISDETGLMKAAPSYSKVAQFIGLDAQEHMEFDATYLDYEDLDAPGDAAAGTRIVRADVDSRDFSEQTLHYIETVGGVFNSERPFMESFNEYLEWYQEYMTPEREKEIFLEIIELRNETLLRYLDRALPGYNTIVVPWGALHMPGLERALLERDFTLVATDSRLAVAFDELYNQ